MVKMIHYDLDKESSNKLKFRARPFLREIGNSPTPKKWLHYRTLI